VEGVGCTLGAAGLPTIQFLFDESPRTNNELYRCKNAFSSSFRSLLPVMESDGGAQGRDLLNVWKIDIIPEFLIELLEGQLLHICISLENACFTSQGGR
jgi:hypothetical protein